MYGWETMLSSSIITYILVFVFIAQVGDSVKDGIGNVPTTPPTLCHCEGPIEDAVLFVKKPANFSSKQLPLVLVSAFVTC